MSDEAITSSERSDRHHLQLRDHIHTRKAAVAIVTELIIGVLLFLERIDDTAGLTGIVGIAAYILGNGVAAWKREDVQPVIRSGVNYGRRVDD